MFEWKFFEFPFIFWKNFPEFAILRKSSVMEIKLTLLHEEELSENIRFSQTKIIEKVRFFIYFSKKPFSSERNFVLIFYCSYYDFHGTLEKSGKYAILNPV